MTIEFTAPKSATRIHCIYVQSAAISYEYEIDCMINKLVTPFLTKYQKEKKELLKKR